MESVALNIAEGHAQKDGNRPKGYATALGSAAEVCAVLDLVDLDGAAENQEKLRRVGLMLTRLLR